MVNGERCSLLQQRRHCAPRRKNILCRLPSTISCREGGQDGFQHIILLEFKSLGTRLVREALTKNLHIPSGWSFTHFVGEERHGCDLFCSGFRCRACELQCNVFSKLSLHTNTVLPCLVDDSEVLIFVLLDHHVVLRCLS